MTNHNSNEAPRTLRKLNEKDINEIDKMVSDVKTSISNLVSENDEFAPFCDDILVGIDEYLSVVESLRE